MCTRPKLVCPPEPSLSSGFYILTSPPYTSRLTQSRSGRPAGRSPLRRAAWANTQFIPGSPSDARILCTDIGGE
ncbi:hypothetical protein QVD99_003374 [Batrachochytrium dendrobatidis]|nr:hypothetical protein O5D80_008625 [Batrachochytrium dendrobatidis]KAK5670152.1 hypothetical protein QVD99_003374 [Batrachochytrium dendrobatidis]